MKHRKLEMNWIYGVNLIVGLAWLFCVEIGFCQATNTMDLKWWLSQKSIIWTTETNGFRTGAQWFSTPDNEIDVFVLSLNTNDNRFIYPPDDKLPKMELRGTNGTAVPVFAKATERTLPKKIPVKNLPLLGPPGARNGPVYHNFFTAPSSPNLFRRISVSDAYRIGAEGDYTLTVFPVAYRFETNYEFLDRVDFPSVTITIHLSPGN